MPDIVKSRAKIENNKGWGAVIFQYFELADQAAHLRHLRTDSVAKI